MHAFDRQTDRQTDSFLLTKPPCIQCSAVITVHEQSKYKKNYDNFKSKLYSDIMPLIVIFFTRRPNCL